MDIISGEVTMMFDSTSSAMGQIRAGKFRPIAVTAEKRSAEMPEVPTLSEQGVKGALMAVSVVSTSYRVKYASCLSCSRPGAQKRSRLRRRYQLDRASTRATMRWAASYTW